MKNGLTQTLQKKVLFIKQERCYKTKPTRILINWGSSDDLIEETNSNVYNKPGAIRLASNKILTFIAFDNANIRCPPNTTDKERARSWIIDGKTVVCRLSATSHSGTGIVFANTEEQLDDVSAPLYTMYIKKKKEFRVHVFKDNVIDVQEKRRNTDVENVDYRIRNHASGFVFCRDSIVEPSGLRETAINAVSALGLDFGAVDVIWNEKQDQCYALEVNTAPGIEGSTLTAYTEAFTGEIYG